MPSVGYPGVIVYHLSPVPANLKVNVDGEGFVVTSEFVKHPFVHQVAGAIEPVLIHYAVDSIV